MSLPPSSAPAPDALGALLRRCTDRGRMPGATWWVERCGVVLARGAVGHATREPEPEPTTETTPYDLASLTKPLVTALLLVLLEDDGVLDLDDEAVRWLPELRRSPLAGCSLLSLAVHGSGLPAWAPLCARAAGLTGYVEAIARIPRAVVPGRTLYSDLGYILLGAVLSRATGKPLDALFARRVAAPLALPRAGFALEPHAFANAAATERGNGYERALAGAGGADYAWRGHLLRGEVHDANAHGLGGVAGHAGLFANASEVARIGREMLRPGALRLSPRARARLLTGEVADEGAPERTVGFVTALHSRAARGILPAAAPGHTGFTGTSLWLEPGEDRVSVLLTNRVHPVVRPVDFQYVRRAFHRVARRLPAID